MWPHAPLANDDLHDTARAHCKSTYRPDVSDQLISLRHTDTPDTIFEHPKERAAHLELIQQEECAREQGRQRAKKLGMIKGGFSQPIRSTSTREGSPPSDAPRPSSVAADTRVRSCSTMRKSMTSGR